MKTKEIPFMGHKGTLVCLCVSAILLVVPALGQESISDVEREPYVNTLEIDWPDFESDEVTEIPPVGQFLRGHLRVAQWMSSYLAELLIYLDSQGDKVNPLAIEKYSALKTQVDKAIQTKSQMDGIGVDTMIEDIMESPPIKSWASGFLGGLDVLGEWYLSCFERHMIDTNGIILDENARKFAHVFGTFRIPWESEALWDLRTRTHFSRYDVFVCNPQATLQVAKELDDSLRPGIRSMLVPRDIAALDEKYGAAGNANPILKARYTEQKALLLEKITELKEWESSIDADPPAGDISIRDVIGLKRESAYLGRLIDLVEHVTAAKNHVLFPKLKAYRTSLDQLATSAKVLDMKDVILAMLPFEKEWLKIWQIVDGDDSDETKEAAILALGLPEFFYDVSALIIYNHGGIYKQGGKRYMRFRDIAVIVLNLYEQYGTFVSGILPVDLFEYEYLWVARPELGVGEVIDVVADVFALFPDQMTERVKTLPLEERERILEFKGDLLDTPAKLFNRFTTDPDTHPDYVITRYQADQAAINTKYAALIQWHKSQPVGQ